MQGTVKSSRRVIGGSELDELEADLEAAREQAEKDMEGE